MVSCYIIIANRHNGGKTSMRAGYPSDITREEFEVIRYSLETAKQRNTSAGNRSVRYILCNSLPTAGRLPLEIAAAWFSEMANLLLSLQCLEKRHWRWGKRFRPCFARVGLERARLCQNPMLVVNTHKERFKNGQYFRFFHANITNTLEFWHSLERIIKGREQQTTMTIVDSRSVKNTDTAEEKGFDAGKKLQV